LTPSGNCVIICLVHAELPRLTEVDRIRKKRYRSSKRAKYRINHQIRAPKVRLIDADGRHAGIVPLPEALASANASSLDLVEVSPAADPPVVRVMDYGKFLYQQAKRERESRKAQKQVEVKEIRLRPKTTEHHKSFKVRDARRWLEEGMKVKVRIRFRGREITYPEIARQQLAEIAEELSDVAAVEQRPNLEGRTMLMVLSPVQKSGAKG
jgi:translation initiation factor IF-3